MYKINKKILWMETSKRTYTFVTLTLYNQHIPPFSGMQTSFLKVWHHTMLLLMSVNMLEMTPKLILNFE